MLFRREDDDNTVGDDPDKLVLDHIAENDNAENSWEVASILNAVIHRVKNVPPAV